jgi:hypothetical protein
MRIDRAGAPALSLCKLCRFGLVVPTVGAGAQKPVKPQSRKKSIFKDALMLNRQQPYDDD